MEPSHQISTNADRQTRLLGETVERSAGTAFLLSGTLIIASVVVPVVLKTVTDLAWTSGLALIGLAIVAVSVGVFGTSRRLGTGSPIVAFGIVAAGIAGLAAAGLVIAVSLVATGVGLGVLSVPRFMGLFRLTALVMAAGVGLGYLFVGAGAWRDDAVGRRLAQLMVAGGTALLIPVVIALLGPIVAFQLSGWLLFGVLGLVALDTLAIGWLLQESQATL